MGTKSKQEDNRKRHRGFSKLDVQSRMHKQEVHCVRPHRATVLL